MIAQEQPEDFTPLPGDLPDDLYPIDGDEDPAPLRGCLAALPYALTGWFILYFAWSFTA